VGRFTSQDPTGFKGGINFYIYCANNPVNSIDPLGLDTYYVDYELFTSNPDPTNNPISHSYVATTDNGIVTDTYSWGNNSQGQWFHNDPVDMTVAQRAIDSGVGVEKWGGRTMDQDVAAEFKNRENDTERYNWAFNNCKENANSLLIGAINQGSNRGK